jgi:stage V sporulation protein R
LNGYFTELSSKDFPVEMMPDGRVDFYFGTFLQWIIKASEPELYREVSRYNELKEENELLAESLFFNEVKKKYPEFQSKYTLYLQEQSKEYPKDVIEFVMQHSPFLRKEKNKWMLLVMSIIRNTALYFEPQIRTKIINEGWASYWHDELFRQDARISKHEIAYARINAAVTAVPRVGLNPYAIGLRLVQYVEELADKGKLSFNFQKIQHANTREEYDQNTQKGKSAIFELRKHFSDYTLIKTFVDQEFVDKHDLFVTGKRYDERRDVFQYYVKSRKAEDYKQMLIDSLYHPPYITVEQDKTSDENLYLKHHFEGKQLIQEFIGNTMIGIEFLWGAQVQLETTEILASKNNPQDFTFRKVIYTLRDRKLYKKEIND